MADISSTIVIEDGFSEPIQELIKGADDATIALEGLKTAVESVEEVSLGTKEALYILGGKELKNLQNSVRTSGIIMGKTLKSSAYSVGHALKEMSQEMSIAAKSSAMIFSDFGANVGKEIKEISQGISLEGFDNIRFHASMLGTEVASAFKDVGRESIALNGLLKKNIDRFKLLGKNVLLNAGNFIKAVTGTLIFSALFQIGERVAKKITNLYVDLFKNMVRAVQDSIEDINLHDKLSVMYGDRGKVASQHAYELSNELGENQTTVTGLAAKAAHMGIGTKDFDRIMRYSSKISALSPEETTESAANAVMSSIKSSKDASDISGLLGGGQKMTRQLKRAGYERLLRKGDIEGALDVVEKISEEAGFTNEKYKDASKTLSQTFKRVMNTVENIKRSLKKTYDSYFAPVFAKLDKLLKSRAVERIITIVTRFFSWLGKTAANVLGFIIDNIWWIAGLFGVLLIGKVVMIMRMIAGVGGLIRLLSIPLLFIKKILFSAILRPLTTRIMALFSMIATKGLMATIKACLPALAMIAAIAGAVYGVLYLLEDVLGVTDNWVGALNGARVYWTNIFQNIFTWIDRTITRAKLAFTELKMWALELIESVFNFFLEKIKSIVGIIGITIESDEFSAKDTGVYKELKSEADYLKGYLENMNYVDPWKGTDEAYKATPDDLMRKLDEIFNLEKLKAKISEALLNDTSKIRENTEQEEELAWLKAFSNRQIMSEYSSMTSNSRTININGVSQAGLMEFGRRSVSAVPSRNSRKAG